MQQKKIWFTMNNSQKTIQSNLVYPSADGVIKDAWDEQALHVGQLDVQLAGDKGQLDTSVGPDQFNQYLNITKQINITTHLQQR